MRRGIARHFRFLALGQDQKTRHQSVQHSDGRSRPECDRWHQAIVVFYQLHLLTIGWQRMRLACIAGKLLSRELTPLEIRALASIPGIKL